MLTAPENLANLEAKHAVLKEELFELGTVCDRLYMIIENQNNDIEELREKLIENGIEIDYPL